MSSHLAILEPGMHSTIQDLGRFGYQAFGVSNSGALDQVALQSANLLVGNAPAAAALEILYSGPTFRVEAESVRIAVSGADARIHAYSENSRSSPRLIPPRQSVRLRRGDVVSVGSLVGGSVSYLAIEGGFDLTPVLGSLATDVRGGFGGFHGRSIRAGDSLPLVQEAALGRVETGLSGEWTPAQKTFRIVPGPQVDAFVTDALERLCDSEYEVTIESDRMGLRLKGAPIPHRDGHDIVSDVTVGGSIQVPGSRQPIVLLADRQTTGGYPKVATVISADLAALGRTSIGARIGFRLVSYAEALEARRTFMAQVARLADQIAPLPAGQEVLSMRLMSENIIGGVFDALS